MLARGARLASIIFVFFIEGRSAFLGLSSKMFLRNAGQTNPAACAASYQGKRMVIFEMSKSIANRNKGNNKNKNNNRNKQLGADVFGERAHERGHPLSTEDAEEEEGNIVPRLVVMDLDYTLWWENVQMEMYWCAGVLTYVSISHTWPSHFTQPSIAGFVVTELVLVVIYLHY